jgi:hypothetical protein
MGVYTLSTSKNVYFCWRKDIITKAVYKQMTLRSKKLQTVGILLLAFLISTQVAFAADQSKNKNPNRMLTRGAAVSKIVESFNLKKNYCTYIAKCMSNADECFFTFAAMSSFDGISFSPLRLYPDVQPNYRYYDDINVASILGLVHGYMGEKSTPFKPEIVMTRIQALKVVLGAAELMKWKEKFEVGNIGESVFSDIDPLDDDKWWYARYANFAVMNGIITKDEKFYPDDVIRAAELILFIEKALEYKNSQHNDPKVVS